MTIDTSSIYLLFGGIALFLIIVGVVALIKNSKEKKSNYRIEKDKKEDNFIFFMFLTIICLIPLVIMIIYTFSEPLIKNILLSAFLFFLFLDLLLESLSSFYKNNKFNFIRQIALKLTSLTFVTPLRT